MNEAELVASHILNCDRLSLYLNKDQPLNQSQAQRFLQIFKSRIAGQPLQYLLGSTEFMGLEFKVDRRALIPRQETELLVEAASGRLKSLRPGKQARILDLGTGSGCIAVALAKIFPRALIWASDISQEALVLAEENAARHQVKIAFLRSDIFGGFKKSQRFDLIISNPPYIRKKELNRLAREISFEPWLALAGGNDGLNFYRRIIRQAAVYLNPGGYLAMEIGCGQAKAVEKICALHQFIVIEVIKDYNGIARVVIAQPRG